MGSLRVRIEDSGTDPTPADARRSGKEGRQSGLDIWGLLIEDVPSPFHANDRRPTPSGRLRGGKPGPINPNPCRGKDLLSANRNAETEGWYRRRRRLIVSRMVIAAAETSRRYWTAEGVVDGLGTSLHPPLKVGVSVRASPFPRWAKAGPCALAFMLKKELVFRSPINTVETSWLGVVARGPASEREPEP